MEATRLSNRSAKYGKRRYVFTFRYLKKYDSPEQYLSTIESSGVTFDKEKIKARKENFPFGELQDVFETEVFVFENTSRLEITVLQSWCNWTANKEEYGWLSIIPADLPYLEDKFTPVTEIENAKICFGSFTSPTTFCEHLSFQDVSINMEYDRQNLSVFYYPDRDCHGFKFEISSKTFENRVVINSSRNEISVYIETYERFKIFRTNQFKKGEQRITYSNDKTREKFGFSSVFKITFPDKDTNFDIFLQIVSYFKRKGSSVIYADIKIGQGSYSLDELNNEVRFNKFETEYAWQCLLRRGYKVIDSITPKVIHYFRKRRDLDFADIFIEMETKVDESIFFDFVGNWNEALEVMEPKNENTESSFNVRRIVVTPTSELYFKKEPIKQNRVIREYDIDYFIRVVFRDEDFGKLRLMSRVLGENEPIIDRVKDIMRNGFHIGNRHFELLACSNSQMRDHSAWFVAKHNGNTAESIRKSLGDFSEERCVASYVSRLGLCFSASCRAVHVDKAELIDDVEENGYCFTDGIGKMSISLSRRISKELQIAPPSAFQIRYAGCKGVIALDPSLGGSERLIVRKSMKKFDSQSKSLEILQWTQPGQLFLNRQIITLLSGLGVPDEAFMALQQKMLLELANMLIDEDSALDELDSVLSTIKHKCLRKNGVLVTTEPFFRSILVTIYKTRIDSILKKARIAIPWSNGRIMMGTVDETGLLQYGEVFISYHSEKAVPKQFVKKGPVVVTKNPCFHPGDVRTLTAVDVPRLYHMVDCIVFPQNGHRPHPDEMSGSDLDGDMYFVCWEESLIPPEENVYPMEFPKLEKKKLQREIRIDDVVEFLGDYITNDRLGLIANAHVVHADRESIYSSACTELAKMHSDAVDFPKTGKRLELRSDLIVEKYPDFMMKKDKATYISNKILGKLFRHCDYIARYVNRSRICETLIGNAEARHSFKEPGYEEFLAEAKTTFQKYSKKISDVMYQFGINTEAELFTGMILSLKIQRGSLENERFDIPELIKTKMSNICEETRMEFFKEFGGEHNAKKYMSKVVAKASAWYVAAYQAPGKHRRILSFPWLVGEFIQDKTESLVSCPLEIGVAVEMHVRQASYRRQKKFNDLMCFASRVNGLPLIGVVPLNLLSQDQNHLTFYKDKEMTSPNIEDKRVVISSNIDLLQKTLFIKNILEEDPKIFFVLSYLLDWARDCEFAGASKENFYSELDFCHLSAYILNYTTKNANQTQVHLLPSRTFWMKNVTLRFADKRTLGRDIILFFRKVMTEVYRSDATKLMKSRIAEHVLTTFLELALYKSLEESLEEDNLIDENILLPYEIWKDVFVAEKYIAKRMQDKTNAFCVIRTNGVGLPTIYAYGSYEQIQQIRTIVEKKARHSSRLINTPMTNTIQVKDSFIFVFEGCLGEDELLTFVPYNGDHNDHSRDCLTVPVLQHPSKHATNNEFQMFKEACLKQIIATRQEYDAIFHGELSMTVTLGRFYLKNAPKEDINIRDFKQMVTELERENEKQGKSSRATAPQISCMTKSFIQIDYHVSVLSRFLKQNGYKFLHEEKCYQTSLKFSNATFRQRREFKFPVEFDENFNLKSVSLPPLQWMLADVIREKSRCKSLADIRFKISSFRDINDNYVECMNISEEVPRDGKQVLQKIDEYNMQITERFVDKISYVKEKTVYSFSLPCQEHRLLGKVKLLISSVVEHSKLNRATNKFNKVVRRNEVSINLESLPNLSNIDEWRLLLQDLWDFSFKLSKALDTS